MILILLSMMITFTY